MRLRPLPTLKVDAYGDAASQLTFLYANRDLLKFIGSNTRTTTAAITTQFGVVVNQLDLLCRMGYLMPAIILQDRGVDGIRSKDGYKVNWKQIRQLNKAISLL